MSDSDKDSETEEEQPSMMTNSELRSIDLNILGECYVPSSDIFSDNKDEERDDTDEFEVQKEVKLKRDDIKKEGSRNVQVMNRDRNGKKVESLDSQEIDGMLRNSIDNFIYETKDLKKTMQGRIQKNSGHKMDQFFENKSSKKHQSSISNTLPRSLSQKYNYSKQAPHDGDTRFTHVSPMNSGIKRSMDRTNYKTKPIHHPPPHLAQNFNAPPRYSSLMPTQYEPELYYTENPRQIQQYSFNAPRHSDHLPDPHPLSSLNYPASQHQSLDETLMPSHISRLQFNPPSGQKQPSPEFTYEGRPGSQGNSNVKYMESRSVDASPKGFNGRSKRQSNQTIQEEQESRESKESTGKHVRNYTHVPMGSKDEGILADDTVHTTAQGSKYKLPDTEAKRNSNNKLGSSNTVQYDSFSHRYDNTSKLESPEAKNSQMTFLCFNLYEILNRNKIAVKSNPDDNSQDMIIKIFESVAHDLRLKKERVENLENEDIEKTKIIDTLKDKNDQLFKANQKLQKRLDEQMREYTHNIQEQERNLDNIRNSESIEKDRLQQDLERLRTKYRNLEMVQTQYQDEIADCRAELDMYKMKNQDLKYKLRQKEESMFRNKLIRDKANASFDVDSGHNLIDNSEYFNRRKKVKDEDNEINCDDHEVIINTEESEDFSRADPSAEKQRRRVLLEKGAIFDNSDKKDKYVENSWFFKVIKELFAPHTHCDQNELMNIIREQYGKLLQSEELLQLKIQIEIILGLPKNCSKTIIINKVKDLRANSMLSQKDPIIGVKIEDYDHVNKNFEAYEEMKNMFEAIKQSLKLQNTATFTETLRAVKKTLSKKQSREKIEKQKKPKQKMNPSRVALNKTKIDLAPSGSMLKKVSPNRENISPASMSGPASARNDKSTKLIFSKASNQVIVTGGSRFQPSQQ